MIRGITRGAPRVRDKVAEFYRSEFGTLNYGLEYITGCFHDLYSQSLERTKRKFTQAELELIVEKFKGIELSPSLAGKHFSIIFPQGGISEKLKGCALFDIACLEIWARKRAKG